MTHLLWRPARRSELDLPACPRQPLFSSAHWSSYKFPTAFEVEVAEIVWGVHASDGKSQFNDVSRRDESEGQQLLWGRAEAVARQWLGVGPRLFVHAQWHRAVRVALKPTQVWLTHVHTATASRLQTSYPDLDALATLRLEPVRAAVSKSTGGQKLHVFYWNQKFITVFTRTRNWILSWAKWIQSTHSHPTSL
jgi:hypothetical protein